MIIFYISDRKESYFRIFLGTFIINTVLMVVLSIVAVKNPVAVKGIDISLIMWVVSGFILILILILKVSIFLKIFRRSRDPEFFTINYFGKKVYQKGIIRQSEFLTFILAIPFFLIVGAYFIARLINIILYGHI